ncbi:hypothetical protein IWZ03DRAFT_360247 [Phyllosticta citriasiana]|uniref:Uncharacterized protein n=1 Tax=Phyllosticta citriasiana TaxID=595635 RepID=A0ABR1KM72_9PEZI
MSENPKSEYDIHGVVEKVDIDNLNHFIDVIIHDAGPRRQTGLDKRKKEAHDAAQKDLRNLVQDIELHQCPREPPSFDDPVPCQNINRLRNHVDVELINPVISQSDEWKKKLDELVDRCCSRPKPKPEHPEYSPERPVPRTLEEREEQGPAQPTSPTHKKPASTSPKQPTPPKETMPLEETSLPMNPHMEPSEERLKDTTPPPETKQAQGPESHNPEEKVGTDKEAKKKAEKEDKRDKEGQDGAGSSSNSNRRGCRI